MSFALRFARADGRIVRRIELGGAAYGSSIADLADPALDPPEAWWQALLRGARPIPPALRSELALVDLFAGAGGFALGAAMAAEALGLLPRFLAAVDLDREALAVHRRNLGTERTIAADLRDLVHLAIDRTGASARFAEPPELVEPSLRRIRRPDLVIGGPPCEGHSNLNNHSRRDDPRNGLLLAAVASAVAIGARAFVFENVRHVARDRRSVLDTALAVLEAAGYRTKTVVSNAAHYGAPQRRERMFLLGFASAADLDAFDAVLEALRRAPLSVAAAIADLLDDEGVGPFDSAPKPTAENRRRIEYLHARDLYDLPNEQRPVCHRNGTTYTAVYGRLRPDEPAPTITTGFGTPGRGRFVHPLRPRLITPHEAARLQTFPDWFAFLDEAGRPVRRACLEKWIGDAVPPLLGFVVVLAALVALRAPASAAERSPEAVLRA
ncbi:MAG: DNA cytosine methyltransferase [Geminicoccaceae bacterium]|nr:DNA cytosine methyltransferase [Geminicoccaceae bacterium]MCX8100588.1 DNA cytosine methyltransferase [Geminicoccaceae bacterium]MDW8369295.1 DNA cytosine methyltransferase [Geminicoccaceae bacterium]